MPGKPHTLPLKEAVPWGAVGTGRASLAAGSSLAVPRKQEHPHPGASGDEQRRGSPQKEPEPRGVGSSPSAFGLDAAFASKKGFKEFGLPGGGGCW